MKQIKLKSLLLEADDVPVKKDKSVSSKPNPFVDSGAKTGTGSEKNSTSKPAPKPEPAPETSPADDVENDVTSKAELSLKFKQVRFYLIKAMKASAEYYNAAAADPDSAEGTEGDTVADLLEKIYAAFSTGNPKDKSLNDEIFK